MKARFLVSLLVSLAAGQALANGYELRRINVTNEGATRTVVRCHLKSGESFFGTEQGALTASHTLPFTADDKEVQSLVNYAPGIARESLDNTKSYTNWWVRTADEAEFKLIRSNVNYSNGTSKIYQDQSDAGQKLAVFMGLNCLHGYGQ